MTLGHGCWFVDAERDQLKEKALPVPKINYLGHNELPIYERNSSFTKGLSLNEPYSGSIDPWPWLPSDTNCIWSKEIGHNDNFSLQINRKKSGVSQWTMNREGPGAWLERWHNSSSYKISAYIKTEDLEESLTNIGFKVGRTYDPSVLDEIERSLIDQYFSFGKYSAKIDTIIEDIPGNTVTVKVEVKEGERAQIRQINIVGNSIFNDDDLLDLLKLK